MMIFHSHRIESYPYFLFFSKGFSIAIYDISEGDFKPQIIPQMLQRVLGSPEKKYEKHTFCLRQQFRPGTGRTHRLVFLGMISVKK